MGTNRFEIQSESFKFGRGFPRKDHNKRIWHLCFDLADVDVLEHALVQAGQRAKQSWICIPCVRAKNELKSVRWYRELIIAILPSGTLSDWEFCEDGKSVTIQIARHHLPLFISVCEDRRLGKDDFRVKAETNDEIWIWGKQGP